MPATRKGAISFGLVHIPIDLHTAIQDNDIHFNQLCKKDGSRVKYKMVCASCGKEVRANGIVKGFEFGSGQYVTMTDANFEKAKTACKTIVASYPFMSLHCSGNALSRLATKRPRGQYHPMRVQLHR